MLALFLLSRAVISCLQLLPAWGLHLKYHSVSLTSARNTRCTSDSSFFFNSFIIQKRISLPFIYFLSRHHLGYGVWLCVWAMRSTVVYKMSLKQRYMKRSYFHLLRYIKQHIAVINCQSLLETGRLVEWYCVDDKSRSPAKDWSYSVIVHCSWLWSAHY